MKVFENMDKKVRIIIGGAFLGSICLATGLVILLSENALVEPVLKENPPTASVVEVPTSDPLGDVDITIIPVDE